MPLPAWLASTLQVPIEVNVTVEPTIEQTELVNESIENVTGFPDPPPVADTRYVLPTFPCAGGVEVNEIAWAAFVLVKEKLSLLVAGALAETL